MDPFVTVLVLYVFIDASLMMVGCIRMMQWLHAHPARKKTTCTDAEFNQLEADILAEIGKKLYFPHHVWIIERKTKEIFEQERNKK